MWYWRSISTRMKGVMDYALEALVVVVVRISKSY
jgi:hypothetical protein